MPTPAPTGEASSEEPEDEEFDASAEEAEAAQAETAADELTEELKAIEESLDEESPPDTSDEGVAHDSSADADIESEEPESGQTETAADEVDDEILEVFIEEAGEVLETLGEYYPQWRENTEDAAALTEVRRAFHTLKGSGRMVGATVVGELAWSVENMLNRVMDGTIAASPELLALVEDVVRRVPEGVEAFKNGDQAAFDASELATRADALAADESATPGAPAAEGAEENAIESAKESAKESAESEAIEDVELDVESDDIELDDISLEDESQAAPEEDTELDDIFLAETRERMAIIRAFLADPAEVSADLVGAFHTLKGSAGMAEVHTVSKIAAAMENLARQFYERGETSSQFIELVSRSESLIETIAGDLGRLREASADVDEFVAVASSIELALEDQAPRFDFENIRLLSTADEVLRAWDAAEVSGLMQELREVIEQARSIDERGLESLSTSLLAVYERLTDRPTAEVAEQLASGHELLVTMLDAIAASQEVPEAGEMPSQLDALDGSPPQPATPQPATPQPATAEHVELPADEIDQDVLPLFLEEAEEIVEGLDQTVVEWGADPAATQHLDNLLRQLHTLKGGARMSGLASLGEYAHNFETFLIGVQGQDPSTYDDPFFALVNERQDEINRRVEIYRAIEAGTASEADIESMRHDAPPRPGLPSREPTVTEETAEPQAAAPESISQAASVTMAPSIEATPLPEDEVDEDVLPIFLEESEEITEEIDQSIVEWSSAPLAAEHLDNLLRQLHTLKGGARMAGLASLGEFAHNLETWLIGVQQNPPTLDETFFDAINQQQDEINRRIGVYRKLAAGEVTDEELASMRTAAQPGAVTAAERVEASATESPATSDDAPAPPEQVQKQVQKGAAPEQAETRSQSSQQQEMVRVSADLLEELNSLAGESSITRGRVEQQIADFGESLEEMEDTINRIREQVRRLEIEAESRETIVRSRAREEEDSGFDDLEMDRYTMIQEISRALSEGMSDLVDLRDTLVDKSRDAETLLHQQARIGSELQEGLTRTRMVPFARMIPRLRRIVRQVSAEVGKSVRFDAYNVEGELDRTVLERIVAPLEHMLRNAVDHGIESVEKRKEAGKPEQGRISLRLDREGGYVVLKISDDGGGINVDAVREKAIERGLITADQQLSDYEIRQFIMHAGFSTAQKLTQISGRGVGMDVVVSEIKSLGGDVDIDSTFGVGSEFTIRMPFTVSINRALMVVIQDEVFAIPLEHDRGNRPGQPLRTRGLLRA
ncbi:MAG: Hpt domain-containing protein [Gammaproteobacteria bacterium]|nr:Hpt domain-containing protein [Gammaproteobacteria bacterium]